MLKKLRLKFILINMAIVTGLLVVLLGLVYQFTENDLDAESNAMLQSLAMSIKKEAVPNRDVRLPYLTLYITDSGDVLSAGTTHYDFSKTSFIRELINAVYDQGSKTGYLEEYGFKYMVITEPGVQKMAFVDITGQQDSLDSLIDTLLITGGIALAAFCLVSILLAFWAVRPVARAWQQQKQFVSDASHELKTPLTVIMSNAELLQSPDCDEGSRQQFSENILTSSRQMRSLVEGLLELARADNGQVQTAFAPVDFSKTVSDAVLPFEPLFFERSLTLNSRVEPGITVNGSENHLRQIVDILLDNAGKYSDAGIVDLCLQRQGRNQCLLTVANPGNPIQEEDLERIFQRFYRADTARSNTGSFGLGLSIAQSVVQQHGGQIWAESNETGNRFSVLLPCQSEHRKYFADL